MQLLAATHPCDRACSRLALRSRGRGRTPAAGTSPGRPGGRSGPWAREAETSSSSGRVQRRSWLVCGRDRCASSAHWQEVNFQFEDPPSGNGFKHGSQLYRRLLQVSSTKIVVVVSLLLWSFRHPVPRVAVPRPRLRPGFGDFPRPRCKREKRMS